jgi:RNA polymerase subunit RPABC4/transcription elongation factor Spt4
MKKLQINFYSFLLIIFLIISPFTLSTTIAAVCENCGFDASDSSSFCPKCGTKIIQQNWLPLNHEKQLDKSEIFALFEPIEDFERALLTNKYLNILGKFPETKIKYTNNLKLYKSMHITTPEEIVILEKIYSTKFLIFEGVVRIMKNLRINKGYKEALIKSAKYMLELYGRSIKIIKETPDFSKSDIEALKVQLKNTAARSKKFQVTSKFLKLSGFQIGQGEKLMVLGIEKNKALVLHMGATNINICIEGLLTIRELLKRTSFQKSDIETYKN